MQQSAAEDAALHREIVPLTKAAEEPIVLAIVAGATREGALVFMHDHPIGSLRLPTVPVPWRRPRAPEEDTMSSSVINKAFVKYKSETGFCTGELGLVGVVDLDGFRAWVIVVSSMSVPDPLSERVHLVPISDFQTARKRMEAQDPALRAASALVLDELQRRDVIDKDGELVLHRW